MALLFTYGTLRKDERNHFFLLQIHPEFVQNDLISADRCGVWGGDIPLIREGGGTVLGEVWEIPDDKLWFLDRFEGTDHGLYERREVITHAGRTVWVYFPGEELLKQG